MFFSMFTYICTIMLKATQNIDQFTVLQIYGKLDQNLKRKKYNVYIVTFKLIWRMNEKAFK